MREGGGRGGREGGRGGREGGREGEAAEKKIYSGTSDKGPAEVGTTSLQGTKLLAPKCPLFRGSTVVEQRRLKLPNALVVLYTQNKKVCGNFSA